MLDSLAWGRFKIGFYGTVGEASALVGVMDIERLYPTSDSLHDVQYGNHTALIQKLVHRNLDYTYHVLIFFKIISFISLIILLTTILQSWSNHDFYKLIEIKSSNNGWFNSSGWGFHSLMQSYAQPKKVEIKS